MFLIFCFEFDFFNQRCFSHKHDRIKVWWLARPFHDLNVLLFEPLLCCLGCMLWVIVVLEDSSMTHFKCPGWKKGVVTQDFMIQGPIHLSLNAVKLTCPLSRGTHPKHHASTSMLDVGMVFLGSWSEFFLLQTQRIELIPKSSILVSSDPITFSQSFSESFRCSLANFRWACTSAVRYTSSHRIPVYIFVMIWI